MKRYWLQGECKNKMRVWLKSDDLQKAIDRMKVATKEVFIWDCINRIVVDANYDCHIVKPKTKQRGGGK